MKVTHKEQETGYSCGAACLAMVTGLSESACRKLALTKRSGTYLTNVAKALRELGHVTHHIVAGDQYDDVLWQLEAQSNSWPLILSARFVHNASDKRGRRRLYKRQHAVVLYKGKFYDPGSQEPLDLDCVGHLGDRGIHVSSYLIIEQ